MFHNRHFDIQPSSCPEQILELGIFAKTFRRSSIEEVFHAIAQHGLSCTQWNWACVPGFSSLPADVPEETARAVKHAARSAGVRIVAISASFNLIQPTAREQGLARLPALAKAAVAVGCDLLTLCTGTRHPVDMWSYHPENRTPRAWTEMIQGLGQVSRIVSPYGVRLAIEPEAANVVSDAASAQRAMKELAADGHAFSIVLDAANLYTPPIDPRAHPEVIDDALARLGNHISLAHAKDIAHPAEHASSNGGIAQYTHTAAGTGILPYTHYLDALLKLEAVPATARKGQRLPLILHGLDEEQVAASVRFVREAMEATSIVASL